MFSLDTEFLNPMVQSIGWTLIHFLWQGAVVAVLFGAGQLALRRARPVARYRWGLGCLLLMALLPPTTFFVMHDSGVVATAAQPMSLQTSMASSSAVLPDAGTPVSAGVGSVEQALPWLVLLWLVGVLVQSIRVMVNWRRMRRLSREGVKSLPDEIMERVDALRNTYGIRRTVEVLESTLVRVPTMLGWLKPVILIPTSTLVGLTPQQIELVLAHELGHIKRLDYLVNLIQVMVETVLFYHPAVRWISSSIRDEREKCCDDLVVETCGNRLQYAKALANLENIRSGFPSPALAATDGQLLQRIERIVCIHSARPRDAFTGNAMLMALLAVIVIAAGQLADPMRNMESERALLADRLVTDWLTSSVGDDASESFAALEDARVEYQPSPPPQVAPAPARPAPMVTEPTASAPIETLSLPVASPEPAPAPATAEVRQIRPEPSVAPDRSEPKVSPSPAPLSEKIDPLFDQLARTTAPETPIVLDPVPVTRPTLELASQPEPTLRVAPQYPVRARIAGQEGYVVVEFGVRGDGLPSEVKIIESEPRRVFDKAARRAIRAWRFDPGTLAPFAGQRFTQRFDFSLSAQADSERPGRTCIPVTGTRICRADSPTSLLSQEANGG